MGDDLCEIGLDRLQARPFGRCKQRQVGRVSVLSRRSDTASAYVASPGFGATNAGVDAFSARASVTR
jgi:hypothetical protein